MEEDITDIRQSRTQLRKGIRGERRLQADPTDQNAREKKVAHTVYQ